MKEEPTTVIRLRIPRSVLKRASEISDAIKIKRSEILRLSIARGLYGIVIDPAGHAPTKPN